MSEVTIVGVDLAKRVFQPHGARSDESIGFRKKLSRNRRLAFLDPLPPASWRWRPARQHISGAGRSKRSGMRFD